MRAREIREEVSERYKYVIMLYRVTVRPSSKRSRFVNDMKCEGHVK